MKVGDVVIYHDEKGEPRNALLTAVWGIDDAPAVNLVTVSTDETMLDQYGRQTGHVSSVSHGSSQKAHGRYWRRPDEEPNAYTPPSSV